MNPITLNIAEIIGTPNAIIQKFGNMVFEKASKYLESGATIILDFENISNLTSGFCNASIGKLYSTFPKIADSNIIVTHIEKSSIWHEKIQESIDLVKNPDKAKKIDDAILALFQ
ncbi:MAG: STAS-like domain-containing protein [Cytophagales bacterium]